MRFLVDRCAGKRLAAWLLDRGHDVLEARALGPDPGDQALLERAEAEDRILVTLDTDFGELIYRQAIGHAGLVRLPDVPAEQRILLMKVLIKSHPQALKSGKVITIRDGRIRISQPLPFQ